MVHLCTVWTYEQCIGNEVSTLVRSSNRLVKYVHYFISRWKILFQLFEIIIIACNDSYKHDSLQLIYVAYQFIIFVSVSTLPWWKMSKTYTIQITTSQPMRFLQCFQYCEYDAWTSIYNYSHRHCRPNDQQSNASYANSKL